jgi:uncharacterized protein
MHKSPSPEIGHMSRFEVLGALGATSLILLVAAKLTMYIGQIALPTVVWSWSDLGIGLGLGLAIVLSSQLVYRFWPDYRKSADFYLDQILAPLLWPDLIWLGLLPGLSEELMFRGVMVGGLDYGLLGLLAAALCFGLLHMSSVKQWPYALWAGIIGLILGGGLIFTDNLLVPIVAHVFCNFCAATVWKWHNNRA